MRRRASSRTMRAALPLLLALLAAGCTGAFTGERTLGTDCGPAPAGVEPRSSGSPVWLYALHDAGKRDAVFCVQIDDGPIHRQEMPGATFVPNVKRFTGEDRAQDAMKVTAWIAGDELQVTEFHPVTEENHIVLRLSEEDGLQIDKFEQAPAFD